MADELKTYWLIRVGQRFLQGITPEGTIQLTRSDTLDNVYRFYTLEAAQEDASRIFRWAEQESHEWVHNRVIGIVEARFTEVDRLEPSATPRPAPVPKRPGERVWTEAAQSVLDVWSQFCEAQTGHPNCFERIDRMTRKVVYYLWEPYYHARPDGGIYGMTQKVSKRVEGTFWGDRSHDFNIGGDGTIRVGPLVLKRAWERYLRKQKLKKAG